MESSPVLREDELERLHGYLERNVYERLYNTPTTASKMGRCSSSNARTPYSYGDVLVLSAESSSPEMCTANNHSLQTPKESARKQRNPFDSYSNKTYIDSDPGLAELIREKKSPPLSGRGSFSPEIVKKAQHPLVSRRLQSNKISPDSVTAFTAAASHTKGRAVDAQREICGKSPSAVKRQLFTSETPTRSNRSMQMSNSTQQKKIPDKFSRRGRATPNRLLQKMSPIANERLALEQTKARLEIAASAKRGVGEFFENVETERVSLDEISHVIKELYPELDCNALALLAYESLHSNRDGLVDVVEFQQFVHFLAFFNGVWKDVVYWDHKFGLSVRKKDFVAVSQKLGLFDNPLVTFAELDAESLGRILYNQFCKLCLSNKLQTTKDNAGNDRSTVTVSDTNDQDEPSNIAQASNVNLLPIQEILSMFDSNYAPTQKTVTDLFRRMDVSQSGKLRFSDIVKGFDSVSTTPASKPLALRVYAASDLGEKEVFDPESFYVFVLFLVYFNNLWDYFGFSSKKHLRISKRRFLRAVSKLDLFDHPEEDYERMDELGQGFVSFQDFCMVCARRRSQLN